MTLENADKVITIAFQKKDPNKPELENLKNFVRADRQNTLFPVPRCPIRKMATS
jgi:hypothetical protein